MGVPVKQLVEGMVTFAVLAVSPGASFTSVRQALNAAVQLSWGLAKLSVQVPTLLAAPRAPAAAASRAAKSFMFENKMNGSDENTKSQEVFGEEMNYRSNETLRMLRHAAGRLPPTKCVEGGCRWRPGFVYPDMTCHVYTPDRTTILFNQYSQFKICHSTLVNE